MKPNKSLINQIILDLPDSRFRLKTFICSLFNAQFRLVLNYRIGHFLINSKYMFVHYFTDYLKYKQITKHNCQIGYYAEIGQSIFFGHPIGIIIGEGVKIADNVTIFQNVTIGSNAKIGNNVIIYAGSVIIGKIVIGENSIIGANSFVNKNVPPNTIFAGQPARMIKNINQ